MFSQLKLYLYGAISLIVAGLYAVLKYKSAKLESVSKKLEAKKSELKAKTFEAKMKDNKIEAQQPPPDYEIKPGKYNLAILPILFMFIGCANTQVTCPKLEKLSSVPTIQLEVNEQGCICGKGTDFVFRGIKTFRQHERFYETEIDSYNEEVVNGS